MPKLQTAQGLVPLTQSASAAPPALATAAKGSAPSLGETLERFNPNHFGPGERGGQFAPNDNSGSGDPAAAYSRDAVDTHPRIRNPAIVPVQEIEPPLPPGTLLGAVRGLKPAPPELPPEPKLPVPAESSVESGSAQGTPTEAPASTQESPSADQKNPDFELQPKQPAGKGNTPYKWGRRISDAIQDALDAGDIKAAQAIAAAADGAKWLARQIPSIISSFDAPKDLHELQDAAQDNSSRLGYEYHHIVEKGPQNDDLSPSEQERIDEDDNIVRIPYYVHRQITAYYQTRNPQIRKHDAARLHA